MATVSLVLYVLAFLCFCFAAARVPSTRVDLIAMGLAMTTLAVILGAAGGPRAVP
jgi:hypothetical protein